VTSTIFGSTVGYPSDSLASCKLQNFPANEKIQKLQKESFSHGLQHINIIKTKTAKMR